MSGKATNQRRSKAPSSSEESYLDLYVFACGHGDTLLLRLPGDRWALIDCYLPRMGGVRKRFFEFLDEKKVTELAFVCQTHPDYDHFLGMHDVLTHFLQEKGKSVALYIDGGFNVQQMLRLLDARKRPKRDEYLKLQTSLREWDENGILPRRAVDSERFPISPEGLQGRIDFIPIAPDPAATRRLLENDVEKFGRNPNSNLEANEFSLVLVLAVNDGATKFNVMLCADAGKDGITRSLQLWRDIAQVRQISDRFGVVKVAHHGSIKNHVPELCKMGTDSGNARVAAISAGTRDGLPDRDVVIEFHKAEWTVMVTTTRTARRSNRAVELHFRHEPEIDFSSRTIELSWDTKGNLSYAPSDAVIGEEDIGVYQTAGT